MFIMQAHIIREIIENPVVGERLRNRRVCQGIFGGGGQGGEDIVLCDEMPRTWMQTAGQETREYKIPQRVERGIAHKDDIEEDLGKYIGEVDGCERHFVYEDGAEGVEEDLKGAEERFS